MDVLSATLNHLRFSGSVFLRAELSGPWAIAAPEARFIPVSVIPREENSRIVIFHFPLEGEFWCELDESEPVHIGPGEVAVVTGSSHRLSDSPGREAVDIARILKDLEFSYGPPAVRIGTNDPRTIIACGYFKFEESVFNPIFPALPRFLRTGFPKGLRHDWLSTTLGYFLKETEIQTEGSLAMLNHLAELMFLEIIRGHLKALPQYDTTWLAALRNPAVGKSLQAIHEDPSFPWTIKHLAEVSHVSRSSLIDQFTRFVGIPPIQYLGRWRIQIASVLLEQSGGGLARIASMVGYESEAAFNRAFKRIAGLPPASWLATKDRPSIHSH